MLQSEILNIFASMGLGSQEQRDKVLLQGRMVKFDEPNITRPKTWISNGTSIEYEGGVSCAKLEGAPRRI